MTKAKDDIRLAQQPTAVLRYAGSLVHWQI